jgi:hypothetical protein
MSILADGFISFSSSPGFYPGLQIFRPSWAEKKGGVCGKLLPHFIIKKKIATSILLTLRRIFSFPLHPSAKADGKG